MTLPPMTKNFFVPTTRIKSVRTVMYLINISLTFLLVNRWLISGHFPLSNLYESLIFLSWSFSTIYSITSFTLRGEAKTTLLPIISWSVAPVTLLTCAYAFFCVPPELQKAESLVPALQSNWLIMHVSVMILSYASLILGSLFAFSLLLIVHFELPFSNWLNSIYTTQSNQSKLTDSAVQIYLSEGSFSRSDELLTNLTKGRFVRTSYQVKQVHGSSSGSEDLLEAANLKEKLLTNLTKGRFVRTSEDKFYYLLLSFKSYILSSMLFLLDPLVSLDSKEASPKLSIEDRTQRTQRTGRFLHTPSMAGVFLPSDNTMAIAKSHPKDEFFMTKSHSNTESLIYQNKKTQQLEQNTLILIKNNNFLDNLSYRFIGLGFALLTLGIISGAVWANSAWGSYWSWDPKETWAFITWLTYAIYLHLRISKGWYGKQSAFVALFGFFVVWFCYLGVNLFGKGLHSYAFV